MRLFILAPLLYCLGWCSSMPPASYNPSFPSPSSAMRAALMWFERWIVVVQSPSLVRLFATPVDCSTPDLPVPRHLLEFAQIHIH